MHVSQVVKTAHHFGEGLNGQSAAWLSRVVLTMGAFWASVTAMGTWMLVVGPIVGDPYPYALMLLAVGGIAQWLVMIALGVQGNAASKAADARSEQQARDVAALIAGQAEILRQVTRV